MLLLQGIVGQHSLLSFSVYPMLKGTWKEAVEHLSLAFRYHHLDILGSFPSVRNLKGLFDRTPDLCDLVVVHNQHASFTASFSKRKKKQPDYHINVV